MRAPYRRRRLRRTRLALSLARFRRSTFGSLGIAIAAAALAGLTAHHLLSEAAAARERWGTTREVAVVVTPVPAGTAIDGVAVRLEQRPSALVPPGATARVEGRVATVDLVAGEVVVASRLASGLVPSGWRGLAVPPPGAGSHPDLEPGDRVEVLDVATVDPGGGAPGVVVAVRAEDGVVTVAVEAAHAGRVAYAATAGTAVLALIAAPRPR